MGGLPGYRKKHRLCGKSKRMDRLNQFLTLTDCTISTSESSFWEGQGTAFNFQ